jgi:succinate dehydrogenase/fumarate reductase flavoprotein subunit
MAGLVAAARARELGARSLVLEKGDRAGGSMLLSSCVIWRYRTFEDFRRACPGGDERLQRVVFEGFDGALAWLEGLGPKVVWEETPNPLTVGKRFDPVDLTERLVRAGGNVRVGGGLVPGTGTRLEGPIILATGGFPVRYAHEHGLLLRANPWSTGDGIEFGIAHGGSETPGMEEFYGRAMPAPPARITEADYVRLSQLWGGKARVENELGEEFFPNPPEWHESDLAQAIARQPGGTAWFVLPAEAAADPRLQAAREAGGTVVETNGEVRLHVAAAVTHTIGGLRVDEHARVVGAEAVFAAGADAGAISNGGYSSGLAAALVLGRIAADTALSS